jgi:hypothetical protein
VRDSGADVGSGADGAGPRERRRGEGDRGDVLDRGLARVRAATAGTAASELVRAGVVGRCHGRS